MRKSWKEISATHYTVKLSGNQLLLEVKSADSMIKQELNISPVFEFCREVFAENPELLKIRNKKIKQL